MQRRMSLHQRHGSRRWQQHLFAGLLAGGEPGYEALKFKLQSKSRAKDLGLITLEHVFHYDVQRCGAGAGRVPGVGIHKNDTAFFPGIGLA